MDISKIPDFENLPEVKDMPQGCAWGVFDKDGKKDLLGTINIVTQDVLKGACAEAKDGVSISLNWPLNAMGFPLPGRIPPNHKQMTLKEAGLSDGAGWDDEIHFNTQLSSQWDSLVHWHHQPTGLAYNGISVTKEGLAAATTEANQTPTLDHWHAAGGLVSRGVLIDFKEWAEKKARGEGKTGDDAIVHPLDGHRITADEIETIAKDQGVEFRPGDVLIVRTGLTEYLQTPTPEVFAKLQGRKVSGMDGTMSSVKWLWNKHFAAVAGDAWAFEALPPVKEDGSEAGISDLVLHPWLLAMFGMPIGELWDLRALSAHCKATGRYSFMLTSAPLNIPGLIGSPPNALAIF
ncbi:putative cyclase-domain-containing protein [Nemania sp. FL0916]|nr:putative cyclase-domain-containing protein [Nemania sp. FL0916]